MNRNQIKLLSVAMQAMKLSFERGLRINESKRERGCKTYDNKKSSYLMDGIEHVKFLLGETNSWTADQVAAMDYITDLGYEQTRWLSNELFGKTRNRVEVGTEFIHRLTRLKEILALKNQEVFQCAVEV